MSNDRPAGQEANRPRPRIESLSDLIFGLALSIGAITLVGNPPTSVSRLIVDIAIFGFNFVILIAVWINYTRVMSVLSLENRWTISLNIMLLFTVSIEPFLFNLVNGKNTAGEFYNAVTIAYGLDLGILFLILGIFTSVIADDQKNLVPKNMLKKFTSEEISLFTTAALFFFSALIPLSVPGLGLPLRFDFWFFPFVLNAVRRRSTAVVDEIKKARQKGQKGENIEGDSSGDL